MKNRIILVLLMAYVGFIGADAIPQDALDALSHYTESRNKFRCKFLETCRSYIKALDMLPRMGHYITQPAEDQILALRFAAAQFQDLRLRHDLLTGYMRSDNRTLENSVIQDWLQSVNVNLLRMAADEERIIINGWEIATVYDVRKQVMKFKSDLALIISYEGFLAPVFDEGLRMIIDPYLSGCEKNNCPNSCAVAG